MNHLKALCSSMNQSDRLILLVFKLIGLIPFNVECSSLKLQLKMQRNQFNFKWILATLAFFSAEVAVVAIFHERVFFTYYAVGLINDMLKYMAEMVAVCITLMEIFTQRKEHIQIYQRLSDSDLSKLSYKLRKGREYEVISGRFACKFYSHLVIVLIIELRVFTKIVHYSDQWRNIWMVNFPILFYLRFRVLYYIFIVDLIKAQLTSVHKQIQDISETMKWIRTCHPGTKLYRQTMDQVADSLIYLKQCYSEIWYIHFYHNCSSGWSICFIVVSCFIQFSSDLYWLYLTVSEKAPDGIYGMIVEHV